MALLARGVSALLCLALISVASMLVIGGNPVLFTCKPVDDRVEAKVDHSLFIPVWVSDETAEAVSGLDVLMAERSKRELFILTTSAEDS